MWRFSNGARLSVAVWLVALDGGRALFQVEITKPRLPFADENRLEVRLQIRFEAKEMK